MLWFININKNLAPLWSLRPPMDSLIYFEIHHEYVTYQIWSKFYSTKHIPNKVNQLFSSESTFSGFLKFLTLAKRDFLLFVPDKATNLNIYLSSGAQLKQAEELRCAQNNRTGEEGSGGPLDLTSFRSTPALPACVSPFDTTAPLRLSSTLYKNLLNQHGCQHSLELLYTLTYPLTSVVERTTDNLTICDTSAGNQATCDTPTGNQITCDTTTGNQINCDTLTGNQTNCYTQTGNQTTTPKSITGPGGYLMPLTKCKIGSPQFITGPDGYFMPLEIFKMGDTLYYIEIYIYIIYILFYLILLFHSISIVT
jgi:hypothetical protein